MNKNIMIIAGLMLQFAYGLDAAPKRREREQDTVAASAAVVDSKVVAMQQVLKGANDIFSVTPEFAELYRAGKQIEALTQRIEEVALRNTWVKVKLAFSRPHYDTITSGRYLLSTAGIFMSKMQLARAVGSGMWSKVTGGAKGASWEFARPFISFTLDVNAITAYSLNKIAENTSDDQREVYAQRSREFKAWTDSHIRYDEGNGVLVVDETAAIQAVDSDNLRRVIENIKNTIDKLAHENLNTLFSFSIAEKDLVVTVDAAYGQEMKTELAREVRRIFIALKSLQARLQNPGFVGIVNAALQEIMHGFEALPQ